MVKKDSLSQSEYWKKELAEWDSSGLRALEYCRMKGLGRHKFFYWKKKLSKAHSPIEFIEISGARTDQIITEARRPDLVIRKGQFEVEIWSGFDQVSLERVLRILCSL